MCIRLSFFAAALVWIGSAFGYTFSAQNLGRGWFAFAFDFGYSGGGVKWLDLGPSSSGSVVNYGSSSCTVKVYNSTHSSIEASLGSCSDGGSVTFNPDYLDWSVYNGLTVANWFEVHRGSYSVWSGTLQPGETQSGFVMCANTTFQVARSRYSYSTTEESGTWNDGETAWFGSPPVTTHTVTILTDADVERDWNFEIRDGADVLASGTATQGVPVDVELPSTASSATELVWIDPATGAEYAGELDTSAWTAGGFDFWTPQAPSVPSFVNNGLFSEKYRYREMWSSAVEGDSVGDWREIDLEPGDSFELSASAAPGYAWSVEAQRWEFDDITGKWGWGEASTFEAAPVVPDVQTEPPVHPVVDDTPTDGSRWDNPDWVDDAPDSGVSAAPAGDTDLQHAEVIAELEAIRQGEYAAAEGIISALDRSLSPGSVVLSPFGVPGTSSGIGDLVGGLVDLPTIGPGVAPDLVVPFSEVASGLQDASFDTSTPVVDTVRLFVRAVLLMGVSVLFVWGLVDLLRWAIS